MDLNRSRDAVIVGSGPNGLAAAGVLAQAGLDVLVVEAHAELGGGMRSAQLTLPDFVHDVCSSVHPLGFLSPCFKKLPLDEHGLSWASAPLSVAHPLLDGPAATLSRSVVETAGGLDGDAEVYRRLMEPFLDEPDTMMSDLLGPLRFPRRPLKLARFGWYGVRPASRLASLFGGVRARALLAGCAAHSILPLDRWMTGAVGLLFMLSGHYCDWPMASGGSQSIVRALASYLSSLGVCFQTNFRVGSLAQLPRARAYLFDVAPKQVVAIAGEALPGGYRRRLERYRYGPGVFKLDWALSGPIPWRDPACAQASTVHVGGTLEQVARAEAEVFAGRHPKRPFVLVTQQSHFDATRAPEGKHTGYAYCHVPHASQVDMTQSIEEQIERFAPGFRDLILARHAMGPADLERYNESFVGGVIAGGVADYRQLFTRPVARLNPYTTPNPSLFLCSAATPPGGGVHGMCGYYAARSVLKRRFA